MAELLRLATAGSVDDGKSTLIGRLLYDAKGIFEDQLEAIRRTSEQRGNAETDLALLTDGLRAERENRVIDHDQEGSMEIKKREGYF